MSLPNHSYKEDGPSFSQFLRKNDVGLRLLIALFAWFAIFLFLHFREIRVELLELNTTADNYVVGTVDFEFPDDEATVILKQDAVQSVSAIYQMKATELRGVRYSFENYLLQNTEWRNTLPFASYEEMYQTADGIVDLLLQIRFTDAKTLQKMKELEIPVNHYFLFSPPSIKEALPLPKDYWRNIKESFLALSHWKEDKKPIVEVVLNFFENKKWTLVSDLSTESSVKEMIYKSIPQKFSQVKAGTHLVDPGEIITSKHLAMLQSMQEAVKQGRSTWSFLTIFGDMIIAFLLVFLTGLYFYFDQRKIFASVQKLSLIVCIVILTFAFAKVIEYLLVKTSSPWISSIHYPVIIPFAAILSTALLNSRVAFYLSFFLTAIASIVLAVEHSCFLLVNLVGVLIAVVTAKTIRKRKDVFVISAKCLVGIIPLILAITFIGNRVWSQGAFVHIVSGAVLMMIIAILVSGLLPMMETLFNVMTDITLMEYMDPTSELLRKLTLEMPGTYQHSLVLGNIAESAAQSIGANGLLCRVATLYHDIGKLNNIHYFTENQKGGMNIHQLLTPAESAQIIISHVTDGEILAKKYHLPQPFIDIIREHHGTTLVYYFYCKELEMKGGRVEEVDEKLFRYPGPKPKSKESAIIMIADAAEAASRSMEDLTEESFEEMVERVVSDKVEDKQFTECQLTFEELEIIKRTLVKTLMITRHVRVKYPEKK